MGKYDALIEDLDRLRHFITDERENNNGTLTDEFYLGMISGITIALCSIKRRSDLEGEKTNA